VQPQRGDGFAGRVTSRPHYKPPRPASAKPRPASAKPRQAPNAHGHSSRAQPSRRQSPSDQAMFRQRAAKALAADMAAVQDLR
jgi:hypothetical protein